MTSTNVTQVNRARRVGLRRHCLYQITLGLQISKMDPALTACREDACEHKPSGTSGTEAVALASTLPQRSDGTQGSNGTKVSGHTTIDSNNTLSVDADVEADDDCGLQPSDQDIKDEEKLERRLADTKVRHGWRKLVRNFTPSQVLGQDNHRDGSHG